MASAGRIHTVHADSQSLCGPDFRPEFCGSAAAGSTHDNQPARADRAIGLSDESREDAILPNAILLQYVTCPLDHL